MFIATLYKIQIRHDASHVCTCTQEAEAFNWWMDKEHECNNRILLSHKTVKPCHLQEHGEKLQDIVLSETNQTYSSK